MCNFYLTPWQWVTCRLDDSSYKKTCWPLQPGLHWAIRSCGWCSVTYPPLLSTGSIEWPAGETQSPQLLQLPLMDYILLSEPCNVFQSQKKKTERKGRFRMWWQGNTASMKTFSELGSPSAWLILTTYTRIKMPLLAKSHVWINHRALVKGTMIFLSSQSWQFSLKRQNEKRPTGQPLPEAT